jgi:WD40 repeat protein
VDGKYMKLLMTDKLMDTPEAFSALAAQKNRYYYFNRGRSDNAVIFSTYYNNVNHLRYVMPRDANNSILNSELLSPEGKTLRSNVRDEKVMLFDTKGKKLSAAPLRQAYVYPNDCSKAAVLDERYHLTPISPAKVSPKDRDFFYNFAETDAYKAAASALQDAQVLTDLHYVSGVTSVVTIPPYGYHAKYSSDIGTLYDKDGKIIFGDVVRVIPINKDRFLVRLVDEDGVEGMYLYDFKNRKILFKAGSMLMSRGADKLVAIKQGNRTAVIDIDGKIVVPYQDKAEIIGAHRGILVLDEGDKKVSVTDFGFNPIATNATRVFFYKDIFAISSGPSARFLGTVLYDYDKKRPTTEQMSDWRMLTNSLMAYSKNGKTIITDMKGNPTIDAQCTWMSYEATCGVAVCATSK